MRQGHEHRIRPIVARAAAIFAERVEVYCEENRWRARLQKAGQRDCCTDECGPAHNDR